MTPDTPYDQARRCLRAVLIPVAAALAGAMALADQPRSPDAWYEAMLTRREAIARRPKTDRTALPLPDFGSDSFTITLWLRTAHDGALLAKAPPKGKWVSAAKALFIRNGRLSYDIGWVGCVSGHTRIADNAWHHVAFVAHPDYRQEFYVDGALEASGSLGKHPDPPTCIFKIGRAADNFPESPALRGSLDELLIFPRALTVDELTALRTGAPLDTTVSPIAHWPFEDNVEDIAAPRATVGIGKPLFAAGHSGRAVVLDGTVHLQVDAAGEQAAYAVLWSETAAGTRNPRDQQEMDWERNDGIWDDPWPPGNYGVLAARYATACKNAPADQADAQRLLPLATSPAGLWRVRDVYIRSHRRDELRELFLAHNPDDAHTVIRALADRGWLAPPDTDARLRELVTLKQRAEQAILGGDPGWNPQAWTAELEALGRRVLAACDATRVPRQIVFVARFKYGSNHYYTDFINAPFRPGGGLRVLDLPSGHIRSIADELQGGVFGRFDVSFDATRVVFAWKRSADEGYRLYECRIDGTGLRQLTFPPDNEAELVARYRRGYHHGTDDMDPCYLPDGGIAFISTRCQYGILCDQPDIFTTTVLYRMDADGGNMAKLTNSSVSEATPSMANDGQLIYTRWEYVDKGAVSVKCIWSMHPDGSASAEVYGNDLNFPPTLTQARSLPGEPNAFVCLGTPHYPQNSIGTVIRLDTTRNIRTREPMTYMTPDVDVRSEGGYWWDPSRGQRLFKDPYPLAHSLFLVSMTTGGWKGYKSATDWRLCLLDESGAVLPCYTAPDIGAFLPYPLAPRPTPPVLASVFDDALATQGLARCVVADVYAGLEGVERGTIKYIRINEQVPRPWAARRLWDGDVYDQQHACITKDTHLGLKVQHGVVPVADDGSAHFLVPADRNIFFQVLDENYMEVQRERTYVNYRPGETRSCVGCHVIPNSALQADRVASAATPAALAHLATRPGPQPGERDGHRPLNYPTDVQPILDAHCIRCHGGDKPKGNLDLSGTETALFSVSYESLLPERRRGNGRRSGDLIGPTIGENHPKTGNVNYLPPRSLGSHASILVAMLNPDSVHLDNPDLASRAAGLARTHRDVRLSREEMIRLTTWVDSNGQYYGSWWGRRNKRYAGHPNYRPTPTFDTAVSRTPPLPDDQR